MNAHTHMTAAMQSEAQPITHLTGSSEPTGQAPAFKSIAAEAMRGDPDADASLIAQATRVIRLTIRADAVAARRVALEDRHEPHEPPKPHDRSDEGRAAFQAVSDLYHATVFPKSDEAARQALRDASAARKVVLQLQEAEMEQWRVDVRAYNVAKGLTAIRRLDNRCFKRLVTAVRALIFICPVTLRGLSLKAQAAMELRRCEFKDDWTEMLDDMVTHETVMLCSGGLILARDETLVALQAEHTAACADYHRVAALYDQSGDEADDAVVNAAYGRCTDIAQQMSAIPAQGLAGLKAKVQAVDFMFYDTGLTAEELSPTGKGSNSDRLIVQVIDGVRALSDAARGQDHAAPGDRRVHEAYLTWLHTEHVLLARHLYPGMDYPHLIARQGNAGSAWFKTHSAEPQERAAWMCATLGLNWQRDEPAKGGQQRDAA